MKGKPMNITSSLVVPLILGIVCAVIVGAVLSGRQLPLISSPRAGLVALLVVGMAMCMGGIGQVGASGRWASPLAILGYLLGSLILVVFVSALAGWKLPLVQTDTQAVTAIAALMVVKALIATSGFFLHLL
jgi:hypothetical protein